MSYRVCRYEPYNYIFPLKVLSRHRLQDRAIAAARKFERQGERVEIRKTLSLAAYQVVPHRKKPV